MAVYGLTTDGLIIKTLPIIREELAALLRERFGTSVKSSEDQAILGQFVGIISELAALIWEQLEVVNSSQDPDKAVGAALDALCILTGTTRPAASYSTVTLSLTGDDTTVVTVDSQVKTESTDVTFETIEAATLEAADAWTALTVYAIGDRVTNGGNIYQCITAGTSDAAGGPTTEDEEITDATVEWTFVGNGEAVADVTARATVTGPTTAFARDLVVINTNVAGWNSVINLNDASPGRDVATDEELRQLREAELATSGNTPIDALRAELLNVADVEAVTVFVNNTDETDADGMPPHSVEAMVKCEIDPPSAAFDQSIWDALLAGVAAGVQTAGSIVGTATDSQGTVHTMKFSRPEELDIYVILDIIANEDDFPTDGADLIAEAISLWGEDQVTGKNAVASQLAAIAFETVGVLDVSSVKIGTAPGPTLSTTIPVSLRQLAVYDTANITVNVTFGVP